MQNLLHEENVFFLVCKIIPLYTIYNLCVVIEIYASLSSYSWRMMSRNTLFEPQPKSAS